MIHQHHHPEMLLYTVGLKSVHFLGNADLTDWYVYIGLYGTSISLLL